MMSIRTVGRRSVLRFAVTTAVVGVGTAIVLANDQQDTSREHVSVELPMEESIDGMTHEDYLDKQAELFNVLTAEIPQGVAAGDIPARVQLTPEEVRAIDEAAHEPGTPLQVGLVKRIDPIIEVGQLDRAAKGEPGRDGIALVPSKDGGWLWTKSVQSPDAGAIRVHIENMGLPQGAELYFYSLAGEAFGPYTGEGPEGTGEFWTESLFGDSGILQLRVPPDADEAELRNLTLSVTEVGYISQRFVDGLDDGVAASFCGNKSCVVNAACFGGTPAESAKRAVAKYEWIANGGVYSCSGGLINDNNPNQTNYFLTANHCINKTSHASNAQFYWRFATSSCNSGCPRNSGWRFKTVGAAVRATGSKGDFTLLQLKSNPPSGSIRLGWTTASVANYPGSLLYRISHPKGGPQAYSRHFVSATAPQCSGFPRGQYIYSKNMTGAIAGGSSGSPVVNAQGKIVGQLYGACGYDVYNVCNARDNATLDGAFKYYYNSVKPYLKP